MRLNPMMDPPTQDERQQPPDRPERETTTAVIAETDADARAQLRRYLEGLDVQVVAEARDGDQALELVDEHQPDLLFVAEDLAGLDGLEVATHLAARRSPTLVTLLATQGRFNFLRKAMQAGVRELLLKPVQRDEIEDALQNLKRMLAFQRSGGFPTESAEEAEHTRRMQHQQMMIAIFSSKGGVGKTFVAVNLAVMLRQLTQKRIVLVDLNFQTGDVTALLDILADNRSLRLVEAEDLKAEDVQATLIQHPTGLDVLPAPRDARYAELFSQSIVQATLDHLQQHYDYVLIDTPSSFTEPSLTALDLADRIIYLTSPSVPALKNTRQGLDIMQALHYPASKIWVVLNYVELIEDISLEDIQACLQEPIRAILPYDPHTVMDSINAGVTLLEGYSHARVTQALEQLTRLLLGYPEGAQRSQPKGWIARLRTLGGDR